MLVRINGATVSDMCYSVDPESGTFRWTWVGRLVLWFAKHSTGKVVASVEYSHRG